MAKLKDLFEVDRLLDDFKNIRTPEDLSATVQSAQDVVSGYASQIKKVPADLERWESTLQHLGILSENTNMVSGAKDILFKQVYDSTKGTILEGKLGLEKLIKSKGEKTPLYYSVGGVKIDYIFDLKPRYTVKDESQPIVSSKDLDRLNEYAESENPTYSMRCGLKGDDAERRFEQILSLTNSKVITRVIANKVFDRVLINVLSPRYTNADGIGFDISFKNVFVAQLKRTANRLIIKSDTPVVETPTPTTPQQIPATKEVQESLAETKSLGIVTPITYQNYQNTQAETISYRKY